MYVINQIRHQYPDAYYRIDILGGVNERVAELRCICW